ncbi:MAG: right-handed parallel beta-helix repeat-containing protein [Planctomycetes bacterium]|nr:right-handed parallel beta-helix repeat-containing protein [Planctomycetota bacterium]
MSNGSCTAVLDVFRIDGTQVPNADKVRQGSIVNIYNPYRVDYEELPDPPNNRIEIELTWTAGPSGSTATLEENGPRLGKGTLAIFDGNVLLKPTDHQSVVLNLSSYTSPKRFRVEAYKTGVTNLKFVIRDSYGSILCQDDVRVSGISDLPKDGRIVFVNPQASSHSTPYDDYETNAASTVKAAVAQLQAEDNIVIAPLRFPEIDLILDKSCVIAGISGYFDPGVELTKYNLSGATVLDANKEGRIFEISTDSADTDSITITGLRAMNGKAENGGAVISEDDADASLRLSFCGFENNEATASDSTRASFAAQSPSAIQLRLGLAAARPIDVTHAEVAQKKPVAENTDKVEFSSGGAVYWFKPLKGVPSKKNKTFNAVRCLWMQNFASFNGGAIAILRADDPKTKIPAKQLMNELREGKDQFKPVMGKIEVFMRLCGFERNVASLQGGAIAARQWIKQGGGIDGLTPKEFMTGGAPIHVASCIFKKNRQSIGMFGGLKNFNLIRFPPGGGAISMGGINCSGSIVEGSIFMENEAENDGGAIALRFMATMTIRPWKERPKQQMVFYKNKAGDGGGAIYLTYFSVLRIMNNIITTNSATKGAGGIHATSGSVVDVVSCLIHENKGGFGGGLHNRNSRMDLRENTKVLQNEASKSGGGVLIICQDDSHGKEKLPVIGSIPVVGTKPFWKFPESAVCPAILNIRGGVILNNFAEEAGGGVMAIRWPNSKNKEKVYIEVNDKILRVGIFNCSVDGNSVGGWDKWFEGGACGLALRYTWESKVNVPEFKRDKFKRNLKKAFNEYFPFAGSRWPPGDVLAPFDYVVNIMLWDMNDLDLSLDEIVSSTFDLNIVKGEKERTWRGGGKFYQAANSNRFVVTAGAGGLVATGNKVLGTQRPPGLLTVPKPHPNDPKPK